MVRALAFGLPPRSRTLVPAGAPLGGRGLSGNSRLDTEKPVNPAIHKLHSPSGWATDKGHVDRLVQMGAKGIRLRLTTGVMLQATLKDLIAH